MSLIKERFACVQLLLATLLLCSGCARIPYKALDAEINPTEVAFTEQSPQIEYGKPNAFVDGLGHYLFSLPSKLILWNWKIGNHDISPETVTVLEDYLEANNLKSVKIRVNQYAPGGEWSRLANNTSVGAGWRYTIGALTLVFYTVLPGRVFSWDNYNPYTNTVNLYSDHPSVVLHEAGHAKDFAKRTSKGSYGALRLLPLVSLIHEAEATGDTLGYLEDLEKREDEKKAYKVLYPAYSTYIGGELVQILNVFSAVPAILYLLPAIPAHVAGRMKAGMVDSKSKLDDLEKVSKDPEMKQREENADQPTLADGQHLDTDNESNQPVHSE